MIPPRSKCWQYVKARKLRDREYADRIKGHLRESKRQLREKFLTMYGPVCECCGITTRVFLCLHHRKGGGNQDRASKGYHQVLRDAVRKLDKSKYGVLCCNCNYATMLLGVCPHGST